MDATSISIGVEGGVWWGATNWQDLPIQDNLYGQMTLIQAAFGSTYHKNVAISMPSLTNQSCGDSQLAVCLAGQVGAIYRPSQAAMDTKQVRE